MQRDESAQAFHVGYHSTTDSAVTLTTISDLGPGLISAIVTFTSHQSPADIPSNTRNLGMSKDVSGRCVAVSRSRHGS